MNDRYLYPALFTEDADGVAVEFPDVPGCVTCADSLEEAYDMAREALGLHLYGMEEDGDPFPVPTNVSKLMASLGEAQFVMLVEVWMPPIRGGAENKAVKKTLTIPKWLNELAERHNVNFSQVLQDALRSHLGIDRRGSDVTFNHNRESSATLEPVSVPGRALRTYQQLLNDRLHGQGSAILYGAYGSGKTMSITNLRSVMQRAGIQPTVVGAVDTEWSDPPVPSTNRYEIPEVLKDEEGTT